MKICVLKESLGIGGTERSAANISKVLNKENEVLLALYDGSNIKYSYGGELVDFHLPPNASFFGKVLNTFLRDIKLRKLIKQEHIDVLYTFTGICNRQTRYKYNTVKIISSRDFGGLRDLHPQYSAALKNSDAMIFNSEYSKQFYLSKYPKDTDKVFSLYNYINVEDINDQAREPVDAEYIDFLSKHKHTVVSVGRFCKEKGFEYLIEAFDQSRKENPETGLVLVGDGDYKSKYIEMIERLKLEDHVYFTGFQTNPYKYMKKSSLFVLSSLSEGFPNVLAEAMSLGLPVISTNCYSGPAEILRNDCNYNTASDAFEECDYGVLTPRFTDLDDQNAIFQLAKAINTLLNDENKMAKYSAKAIERAVCFSKEATADKLNGILSELMARRKNN